MAIAIEKSQREKAKRENKALFQIMLDAKHMSKEEREKMGIRCNMSISGAATPERAKELYDLMYRWLKEETNGK